MNSDRIVEEEQKEEGIEIPNKIRNQILSGIVAVASMTGYAFYMGLVQVTTFIISNYLKSNLDFHQ